MIKYVSLLVGAILGGIIGIFTPVYVQLGPLNVQRPSMSSKTYEEYTGSAWQSVASYNLLSDATSDVAVNAHKLTGVADPTLAQDAVTLQYFISNPSGGGVPSASGSVATTDATANTVVTGCVYTLPSNKSTSVTSRVMVEKSDHTLVCSLQQSASFRNASGVVTQGGSTVDTLYGTAPCDASLAGVVSDFAISGTTIQSVVTGLGATNLNWKCYISYVTF